MALAELRNRLDRPVDDEYDHVLGPPNAAVTLVEYGSYACPHCRAANERIVQVRDQLGDRLRYVFRHRPLTGSDIARRAAELVERAPDPKSFWDAHVALMTRSETLTEEDLVVFKRERLNLERPQKLGPLDVGLIYFRRHLALRARDYQRLGAARGALKSPPRAAAARQ